MSDFDIVVPNKPDEVDWNMDIDVINGEPSYVISTEDQRAAIAAYQAMYSIPGMLDVGVDMSSWYKQTKTIVEIDNQVRQGIQNNAAPSLGKGIAGMFVPFYEPVNGSLSITVMRAE